MRQEMARVTSGAPSRVLTLPKRACYLKYLRIQPEIPMTSTAHAPVAHVLADFIRRTRWDNLPQAVRREAVRAFVNWVGCTLGGSNTQMVDAAVRGSLASGCRGAVPLLGRSEQLDPTSAAVINCMSSAAHAFDDTHLKTITHPTGPVAGAALALAGMNKFSGEVFLTALALGIEVECRLALAITNPAAAAHGGWYITGVAGGFGAAAAAGSLLDLDHDRLVSALALAAAQAAGVRATHGSMGIAYVPGLAARNGLTAAYMAAAGLTCNDFTIDGRNGLLEVMAPRADVADITRDLGTDFEMLKNAYKPYPCGIVIHPAIDACLEIAARHSPRPDEIEQIELEVNPGALKLAWRKLPTTALEAQVSLYHWAGAVLVFGAAGIAQGELKCVDDKQVRALQSRMSAVEKDELATDQARATVSMKDGAVYRAKILHATGSIHRPMSEAQLWHKFGLLAKRVLSDERAAQVLMLCRQVADLDDAGEVGRAAAL